MKGCEKILEERLGPQNYVRGLSQLSPGRQPVLTNLSSEVSLEGVSLAVSSWCHNTDIFEEPAF